MAFAVTHVLIVIIILDLIRHYIVGKEKFPRYLVIIGGIAGLAPDIDVPLGWLLSLMTGQDVAVHRLFTHSIVFVALFLIAAAGFHFQKKEVWRNVFLVIAAGWLVHLVLDCAYGGEPIRSFIWPFAGAASFCPRWDIYPFAASIDAILLVVWLVHEEVHKRIKDYF